MRLAEYTVYNNDFEFTAEKIHYPEGELQLDGWAALQYTRMRKDDPEGIMAGRDDNDK